jgi:predicted nuclease of restriction endonuclease-like RecB superfamily
MMTMEIMEERTNKGHLDRDFINKDEAHLASMRELIQALIHKVACQEDDLLIRVQEGLHVAEQIQKVKVVAQSFDQN